MFCKCRKEDDDDDINKNCKINNNSGNDLVIIDAFNEDTEHAKIIFEQTLKLLDPQNGKTIPDGSSDSVILDDYITDPKTGDKVYSMLYELILVQPKTLFPIKNVSEMMSFKTNSYPDILVSKDDYTQMNSAYQFHQMLGAYPTSNLANDFNKAMQQANQKKASDLDKVMDDFFANTKQFQNVDMNSYTAVLTYMETFVYVWAAGQKSYTYYLYSVPDTSDSKAAPIYEGSVTLTRSSTSDVADPSDTTSGYTCTFTNAKNQNTTLSYVEGQLVDDINADIPNVCLQGSFALKSSFTYNSDDKDIIPILIGTINNNRVLGSYAKQDGSSADNSWYVFWHPQSFQEWMNLFMTLIGVLFALHLLAKGLIWLKNAYNALVLKARQAAGNDDALPKDEDVDALNNQLKDASNDMRSRSQRRYGLIDGCNALRVRVRKLQQLKLLFAEESRLVQRKQQLTNLVHGKKAFSADATLTPHLARCSRSKQAGLIDKFFTQEKLLARQKTVLFSDLAESCPEIPEEGEVETAILEARVKSNLQITRDRLGAQEDLLAQQEESLDNLAQYGVNADIEEVATKLRTLNNDLGSAENLLDQGDLDSINRAKEILGNGSTQLSEINTTISKVAENLGDALSTAQREQINNAQQSAEDLKNFEDWAKNASENVGKGDPDDGVEGEDFPEFIE